MYLNRHIPLKETTKLITRKCGSCEQDITAARLKAMPSSSLCVTCQTEEEKEANRVKAVEDDGRLTSFLSRCSPGRFESLLDYASKKADSQ